MLDFDGAIQCYEQALRHNAWSVPAMQGIACILRTKDQFPAAVEYLRMILKVDPNNGEVWGSLGKSTFQVSGQHMRLIDSFTGHCYLMMDDLQQAYSAYQQALYHLTDPKVCRVRSVSLHYARASLMDCFRNPSSGMVLEFSMTAMVPSSMPKRPSLKSCEWSQILKRRMRFTSASE